MGTNNIYLLEQHVQMTVQETDNAFPEDVRATQDLQEMTVQAVSALPFLFARSFKSLTLRTGTFRIGKNKKRKHS